MMFCEYQPIIDRKQSFKETFGVKKCIVEDRNAGAWRRHKLAVDRRDDMRVLLGHSIHRTPNYNPKIQSQGLSDIVDSSGFAA